MCRPITQGVAEDGSPWAKHSQSFGLKRAVGVDNRFTNKSDPHPGVIVSHAIVRRPGKELARCVLTHLEREPIDIERAIDQHHHYAFHLLSLERGIVSLVADPAFPDGVFVEDTAIVLDEVAVIAAPKPPSRRGESTAIEEELKKFRPIERIPSEAFLEGGDVLRIGRTIFVGQSSRTGEQGLRALEAIVKPLGYAVVPVSVTGCLHLKSAVCALDEGIVIANRAWFDWQAFADFQIVDVPESEPFGANVLRLPEKIVVSSAYPATAELIRNRGYEVDAIEVSELHKAESGVTCMSLIVN